MACRGCLECLLKLLNFLLAVAGLGMIGYGIYLFVEYQRATDDHSVSFIPDQSYVSSGRPMLMSLALSSNFFDNLPKAWYYCILLYTKLIFWVQNLDLGFVFFLFHVKCRFIYLFIGIGVALFVISCCGCVGTCSRSICCLSCVSSLLLSFLSLFVLDYIYL